MKKALLLNGMMVIKNGEQLSEKGFLFETRKSKIKKVMDKKS